MRVRTASWFGFICMTAFLTACPAPPIEIGPFNVEFKVGEGSFPRDAFTLKQLSVPLTFREDLCDLPSEQDLAEQFRDVAGVAVSRFASLSRLILNDVSITATEGDFSFLSSMEVWYVPAPENGKEQDPISLGSASAPDGFGQQIALTPPAEVDFLELIRRNDANPSDACPELKVEVEARSIPASEVTYEAYASIAAYAEVFPRD